MTNEIKDFKTFFRDIFRVEGAFGPKPIMPPFLDEFLGMAFQGDKPAARNILDARSKKQGKSALAGAVALYMAMRCPYGEVVIAASDKDQAKDRVLRAAKFACTNGPLSKHAKVYQSNIELDNQSLITAIPMDWMGAAGGNYSAVIFDELHGYIWEGQRRLYDELIIPPTQPDGCRWIASYAGFLGESELLKEIWDRGLQGEKISQDLPIYLNHNAGLLAFIDTGPESWRMPWMTQEYIDQIRQSERDSTFRRLWLNEWTTAESAFVPMEAWQACKANVMPLQAGDNRRIILGVDASTTRDLTGMVGTWYNEKTHKAEVIYIRAYKPKKGFLRMGKPTVDLEAVKQEIIRLKDAGQLQAVFYDPYQMGSIAIELERSGIRMIEHPQTTARVESDTALYDAIISGQLAHYGDPDLNEHIRNAIAVEGVRGFRLAKEKTSLKIDLAVALSMSLYGCMKYQKHSGKAEVVPNPFYGNEGMDFVRTSAGVIAIPEGGPQHHPEGITWENCPQSKYGCPACVAELDAAGYYDQQQAEVEIIRAAHPEYEHPAEDPPPGSVYGPTAILQREEYLARMAFREQIKMRLRNDN